MTKIMALIDGSIYSKSVCDHTSWAAVKTGANIEVIHVLGHQKTSIESLNFSGNIGLGARTTLLEELAEHDAKTAKLSQKRGRMILADAKEMLLTDGLDKVSIKLRLGGIAETIQKYEKDSSFIIVGKRGEAADFAKMHLGSNLERVVRSSNKPVLVAARSFTPIKRFLIAFDGGPSSLKAVKHISEGKLFSGLECRIIMVEKETSQAIKKLDNATNILRKNGFITKASIEQGYPGDVISKYVEEDAINLVVMGAYGHSRIRSLIIGSTTTEMVRSCKVPVMLFR
jgi:nucleotide-binding universal stress UspA family protein